MNMKSNQFISFVVTKVVLPRIQAELNKNIIMATKGMLTAFFPLVAKATSLLVNLGHGYVDELVSGINDNQPLVNLVGDTQTVLSSLGNDSLL